MKTDLLFESCPFITSANITLSRIGVTDCDALWEIMSDTELYRYERESPAPGRARAGYRTGDARWRACRRNIKRKRPMCFFSSGNPSCSAYTRTPISHT